jgi:hypothetical protein
MYQHSDLDGILADVRALSTITTLSPKAVDLYREFTKDVIKRLADGRVKKREAKERERLHRESFKLRRDAVRRRFLENAIPLLGKISSPSCKERVTAGLAKFTTKEEVDEAEKFDGVVEGLSEGEITKFASLLFYA